MTTQTRDHPTRPTWRDVLHQHAPLLLPVAHDALTARLIQLAGYRAYQIGGTAFAGAHFAHPDVDPAQYAERGVLVRETVAASDLPVIVDVDDASGDARIVAYLVQAYEGLGASAILLAGKQPTSSETMVAKIHAATAARRHPETFILGRTDARGPLGLDEALRRAERCIAAGADGVHVDGLTSRRDLERTAGALGGAPLATSVLEGDRETETAWIDPDELHRLGFSMLLYPTTVILHVARAIQRALEDIKAHRPMPPDEAVTFRDYQRMLGPPAERARAPMYPPDRL